MLPADPSFSESQPEPQCFVNASKLHRQLRAGTNLNLERIYACIHTLISETSQRSPEGPALCSRSEKRQVTYGQLTSESARLSRHLISAGVIPGMLVPFCLDKSIIAVISMLAILEAGGACVAIDPTHQKTRIHSILETTAAKFVLTSHTYAPLIKDISAVSVITVDPEETFQDETYGSDISQTSSVSCNNPDSPAFVVFTSGSSGEPKGTVLQHAAICTSAYYHGRAMHVDASTRVFQYAPYTFDMSIYDIFTTLIYGGCVCIPSDEERLNDITDAMFNMGVNWAFLPPSLVSVLDPEEVPSLKTLQLSAEPASPSLLQKWADRVRLINGYGSTECSTPIISTLSTTSDPGFIGIPYGVGAWIVDPLDHNILLSVDQVGELVLAGPVIAQGYLHDETLTRERFVESTKWLPKEFSQQGLKVYKTGDLAQQSHDGTFKLVGRKGNMVKVRGQRVELGALEKQLSMNLCVRLCIVAFPIKGLYRDLLTMVYQPKFSKQASSSGGPSNGVTSDEDLEIIDQRELDTQGSQWQDLKTWLSQSLPKYMIPQKWIAVKKLPLLSSGKRDRVKVNAWLSKQTLPAPSQLSPNAIEEHNMFLRGTISILRGLTHGTFPLSDQDNQVVLSEAGFDSICQIALNRKIKADFGVPIDLPVLDKSNAIGVSKLIEESHAGKRPKQDIYAVAPLQEYIRLRSELHQICSPARHKKMGRRIFLTGASGFLGIYILRELLLSTPDTTIICLVRGSSVEAGMQRLSDSSKRASWSLFPSYHKRVQVWPGDLSLPDLGLTSVQWACLTGDSARHEAIDAVIHNGAVVHWTKSYNTLSAANVHSTLSLLKAIAASPYHPSMIYISGGQVWKCPEKTILDTLIEAESSSPPLAGYDLSKLFSELLVREFAKISSFKNDKHINNKVSTIRPGYIIGTAADGIANTDDFIWRLVATNLSLKIYNADEADSWLYITGADRVAETVIGLLDDNDFAGKSCRIRNVTDGLTMHEFWQTVMQETKCELRPVGGGEWLANVQMAAEKEGNNLPLWPLLDVITETNGRIGVERAERAKMPAVVKMNVKSTIVMNIEFLHRIGVLPASTTNQGVSGWQKINGAFSRNIS